MKCLQLAAALVLSLVATARSQTIAGVVRDSTSRAAVAGAVVEVQVSAGAVVHRTLTSMAGRFDLNGDGRAFRLRGVRIGFRPREIPIPADFAGGTEIDIIMVRLPTMLEKMKVVAGAKCDQGSSIAGQALLQQARAGLLATVVAREVKPAKLVRLSYERTYGPRLDTMMP